VEEPTSFVEDVGSSLSLVAFLVFGALFLVPVLAEVTWPVVAYAALSLTVVRIVPVAASLLGTRLRAPSVLFLGWFGPRGLASLVFVLAALDLPGRETIFASVVITVGASVVLHGLTSVPAVARYAAWFTRARASGGAEAEAEATGEAPSRRRLRPAG
jgi:NhaP-type Na+/H+ or K+/H+ antiporter